MKSFYKSGGLKIVRQYVYKNDQWLFDESVSYYENGKMDIKGLKEGLRDDRQYNVHWDSAWYKNGQLKSAHDRDRYKTWCENGQIKQDYVEQQGKSKYKGYYCNGQIVSEFTFVNTIFLCTGPYTEWYKDGRKLSERFFEETDDPQKCNIPKGEWTFWDDKGNVIKKEKYKNGKLVEKKEFLPKTKMESQ